MDSIRNSNKRYSAEHSIDYKAKKVITTLYWYGQQIPDNETDEQRGERINYDKPYDWNKAIGEQR